MTGRKAYEMYTKAFGELPDWLRQHTQQGETNLIAWDDLYFGEQRAWYAIAKRIKQHADRSARARASQTAS